MMMMSRHAAIRDDEFLDEFNMFSIKVDDNTDVMEKMRQICDAHSISAGEFVEEWVAFSSTKKQMSNKVTQENLEHLERELTKKKMKTGTKSVACSRPPTRPILYDISDIDNLVEAEEDKLINAYCTPTSKGASSKRLIDNTPPGTGGGADGRMFKKRTGDPTTAAAIAQPFSPQSFSPAVGSASTKYSARTNRGEVVCSFGEVADTQWTAKDRGMAENRPDINISPYDTKSHLVTPYKYMAQNIANKAAVLDDMIDEMGQRYKDAELIGFYSMIVVPAQDDGGVAVGRICCDSNGKLNARSVLLEGSRDTSGGRSVHLDLSNLQQFSLFPGQIVAVEGTNSTGKSFTATNILQALFLPSSPLPTMEQELNIVMAAGPFTTSDSLTYDPLVDLLTYLTSKPPDVCILCGPFVDAKHPQLENGAIDMTFEVLFASRLRQIVEATQKLQIDLVIVPSQRDVHHDPIFPQPPFSTTTHKSSQTSRVHFMPDPCTLNINGVVIGLTSTDILFHLGAEEISCCQPNAVGPDRISRLISHVLTQHNYYPLFPPSPDVNLDVEHFDVYGRLPVTPHILLLPSDLRYFVKAVGDTVCVNPGHLVKGQVGGTFARVVIRPPPTSAGGACAKSSDASLVQYITAEVLRI